MYAFARRLTTANEGTYRAIYGVKAQSFLFDRDCAGRFTNASGSWIIVVQISVRNEVAI